MEHANTAAYIVMPVLSLLIVATIIRARRGAEIFIRKIPGLDAVDEAVGRSAEMGRPVLFSVGLGGIDITTLQAVEIIGHVGRLAAGFRTRVIVPVVDPLLIPVVQEVLREAYASRNAVETFRQDDVLFLSGQQFAYAAGVVGIMNREQVATNFFFGIFAAESLILAETGQSVGAVQIAGTPSALQIPFFIATCDYTVIGEEYYAVTAYLSREPTLVGSVVGQDFGKILLFVVMLLGIGLATVLGPEHAWVAEYLGIWATGGGG